MPQVVFREGFSVFSGALCGCNIAPSIGPKSRARNRMNMAVAPILIMRSLDVSAKGHLSPLPLNVPMNCVPWRQFNEPTRPTRIIAEPMNNLSNVLRCKLFPFENWFPLLQKRPHPFLSVLGSEEHIERFPFELQTQLKRRILRPQHRFLRGPD